MRIYLVIVLLYFIAAPKYKDSQRVKRKGRSSEKQSSVSKYKSKEVEREESYDKTARTKLKSPKKSSMKDNKDKKKVSKTKENKVKEKKKSKRKKTKKKEVKLNGLQPGEIDSKETKGRDITLDPSRVSSAIKQNGRPVSLESSSSHTQTTFLTNTIPDTRVTMTPITTNPTHQTSSTLSTSTPSDIARNTLPVTRTTNSTIKTTGTQSTNKTSTPPISKSTKAPNIIRSSSNKLTSVPQQGPSHVSAGHTASKRIASKEKANTRNLNQKQAKLFNPAEIAKIIRRKKYALAQLIKRKIPRRQILGF
ncbi:hypothetical protein NBO_13g0049 [Nosema bombycis CQ1]|uniref:Uncharacterized protein n=1 Tax=Nosema bombycis (strain CQ1 / CVCC 102059) TaxID=578461 RepID=R0KXF8_NOSB1|nr:hypothetical protein NBO_13g0049 [Nosema bombycis CQ1]|eukprot:EOB14872.1 hypothetical protein NBO_13g0049 [Nosema bombycis CQ1]